MGDHEMLRLHGSEYLGTVLGPPPAANAGRRLRVTAIDTYRTGLHVHMVFVVGPDVNYGPQERHAAQRHVLADWPECPEDQLESFAELDWLHALLSTDEEVVDDAGTEYIMWESSGEYPDRRSLLTGRVIYPYPPFGEATLRFGDLELHIRLPRLSDDPEDLIGRARTPLE